MWVIAGTLQIQVNVTVWFIFVYVAHSFDV